MITSQVASKKSLDFSNIFKENFENVINRSVNTIEDIQRYQIVLRYSSSDADYNVAVGAFMCSSSMKILDNEWINKLKVSHSSDKIGKNKVIPKNKDTTSSKDERRVPSKDTSSEEKIALVLFLGLGIPCYI